MTSNNLNYKTSFYYTFLISIAIVSLSFIWQGAKGFSLLDEGFLWYGAQRVLLGEVPLRDFMAYDPGRYYWSAAFMAVSGNNGILSLRFAVAVFQTLGLSIGLYLISKSVTKHDKDKFLFWIVSAAILILWMFPRHKLFDISLSIFLIGSLTYLFQNPIAKRYFVVGIFIGLIAFFGRNHGVYGTFASVGAIFLLGINRTVGPNIFEALLFFGGGIVVGFAPAFLMMLVVPGFAMAFWESIRFLFELNATNLPLPTPWPWKINFVASSLGDAIRGVLIGVFFIGSVVFAALSICYVVLQRLRGKQISSVFAASTFLALPYVHFAFSRADVAHLAQSLFPLLIGCLALLATAETRLKWVLTVILFSASLWVMHVFHPGWQCNLKEQCVNIEISGSNLQIDRGTASDIVLLRQLAVQYTSQGESFIASPLWPGAYALLERRSPMWEIYALFHRNDTFEQKEIERIKTSNVKFAFLFDLALDGRDDLRFKNTHPLINQYILDNFDPVLTSPNPSYQIYKTRDSGQ